MTSLPPAQRYIPELPATSIFSLNILLLPPCDRLATRSSFVAPRTTKGSCIRFPPSRKSVCQESSRRPSYPTSSTFSGSARLKVAAFSGFALLNIRRTVSGRSIVSATVCTAGRVARNTPRATPITSVAATAMPSTGRHLGCALPTARVARARVWSTKPGCIAGGESLRTASRTASACSCRLRQSWQRPKCSSIGFCRAASSPPSSKSSSCSTKSRHSIDSLLPLNTLARGKRFHRQQRPQALPGPVQARLEGAEGRLQHLLELFQAVPLDVVHRDHRALLGIEPVEGAQDALALPAAFGVLFRAVLHRGQGIERVVFAFGVAHELHDRRASPLADRVDVLAVEHPGEPGPELLDVEQFAGAGEELDQYVLDEVLGVGNAAGESPGEAIEVLDLRAQQILEIQRGGPGAAVIGHGGPGSAERQNRGHNHSHTSARPKRFPAQPARREFVPVFPER